MQGTAFQIYDPEALNQLQKAFDMACETVHADDAGWPGSSQLREQVARLIMREAADGERDWEELKRKAICKLVGRM